MRTGVGEDGANEDRDEEGDEGEEDSEGVLGRRAIPEGARSLRLNCELCVGNYTPGSDEHGPRWGSGGGARGCDFEERVGAHARTDWGHFL